MFICDDRDTGDRNAGDPMTSFTPKDTGNTVQLVSPVSSPQRSKRVGLLWETTGNTMASVHLKALLLVSPEVFIPTV